VGDEAKLGVPELLRVGDGVAEVALGVKATREEVVEEARLDLLQLGN
jgi:hypothetical protein